MKNELQLRRHQKYGPNGDRAIHKDPYFDYEFTFVKDGEAIPLVYISGYDSWWNHFKPHADVMKEVGEYKENFEKAFGMQCRGVQMKKKVIETVEWEVEDISI